ncbi:MAG: ComF family protein [Gemmatimonadaceae bacterium]
MPVGWMTVQDVARTVLDTLLPPVCAVCDGGIDAAAGEIVCGVCWSRLAVLPQPRCDRCGHPEVGDRCVFCAVLPPFVRAARSVCWMPDTTAGPIVHAFKYDGWHRVASGIGARMARLEWPSDVIAERVGLVPVPLSSARLRERGYNQSLLLANALGRQWALPVFDAVLFRTRHTRAQAQLTAEDRLYNVANAFRAARVPAFLHGSHVMLVDDVLTTSATLNACAAALFNGGIRAVSYVTFGRARSLSDVHT